jgi:hypothetical protein
VGKLTHCDLVLSLVYQPYNLLTIRNKVKSGIELTDNLFVPIILEAHHLGHLQLVTSCFDLIEVGVAPGYRPTGTNRRGRRTKSTGQYTTGYRSNLGLHRLH